MRRIFLNKNIIPLLAAALMICHTSSILAAAGGDGGGGNLAYVSLEAPLVVNIFSQDSVHFMQVKTQFKLTDPALAPILQQHMPAIKHGLMLLLSEKRFFEMKTIQGKLQLRKDALKVVQQVMRDKTGDPTVENIFFTSLILQ